MSNILNTFIFSPAKINLYLEVSKPDTTGYHPLKTIFQTIDLYDKLEFSLDKESNSREILLNLNTSKSQSDLFPLDNNNLITKVAQEFFTLANITNYNLQVNIHKYIPIAGGMAGGSSNAAATLFTLNNLYNNILTQGELLSIAQKFGSDIPFCLLGGCMAGTGYGELLTRIPSVLDYPIVLITPPADVFLSTALIFQAYDSNNNNLHKQSNSFETFTKYLISRDYNNINNHLYNDLEKTAITLCPWTERVKNILDKYNHKSLVSGSGPSLFALLENKAQAQELIKTLKQENISSSMHYPIYNHLQAI